MSELNKILTKKYENWTENDKNYACPQIEQMFAGMSPETISNEYRNNKNAGYSTFSNGIKFTHYYACMKRQLKQNGIEMNEATCSMDDMFEAMKYMTIVEKAKNYMNTPQMGGSDVDVDESFEKTLDHFKNYFLGIEESDHQNVTRDNQMVIVEPDEPEETDEDVVLDLVSNALIQIGNVNDQSETNQVTLYGKGVNAYKNANKCVQDYINSVMNAITTKVISEKEFANVTNKTSETYDSFKVKISGYINDTLSGLDNAGVMVTHYIEKNKDKIDLVKTKLSDYANHIKDYVVNEFNKNYTKDGVTKEEKEKLDNIRKKQIETLQTLVEKTKNDIVFANQLTDITTELNKAKSELEGANKNLDQVSKKMKTVGAPTQSTTNIFDAVPDYIARAATAATTAATTGSETTGSETIEMDIETGSEPNNKRTAEQADLDGGKKRRTKKQTRKTKRSKKLARKTKKSNKKNKTTKKKSTKNR